MMVSFRKKAAELLLFLAGGMLFSASAAELLFDFDRSECGWTSTSEADRLERSSEYPASGSRGLLFSGPAWDREHQLWPAFETRAVPKDWTRYDRLAVAVFNDTPAAMLFNIFIGDAKKPFRQGAHFQNRIPPYSAKQLVLKLKPAFSGKIDPADVAILHCYTENPACTMRFFVGNFTLLEPGEPVPPLPETYRDKIRARQQAVLAPRLKQLEETASRLDFRPLPSEIAAPLKQRLEKLFERFRSGEENDRLLSGTEDPPLELRSIRSLAAAASGFAARRNSVSAVPGFEDVLLGYATPMEKVLPRVPLFHPLPETIRIEAAKNEIEAAQLIVMPFGRDRKKVGVTLTAFTGPAGTLPETALTVMPVGFVETTFAPRSGSEYIGFWPDPLLSFLDAVEIKAGKAQPFWIRADIPEDQPAGVYTGRAEIMIDGERAFSVPVSVQVRDFTLPGRSMLPLAVTFWPNDEMMPKCNPEFDPEARKSPAAPVHAWKKHKFEWSEMLADYYLTIDSLYEYPGWSPDFEVLSGLARMGRLGRFNLGNFGPASEDPADNYGMRKTIDRIRPRYEKAKALGLLPHAYLYGCDESAEERFPAVERAAAILKREFPDVPLFTTAYDSSFGTDGRLESIDYFCPLTPSFNEEQAAAARRAGKQVWWYICLVPAPPYANNLIESSAVEPRLLMGAMSAKYRPDGFLYYQTSLWNNTSPITAGPYTDWIAQSFPGYNGDGNWCYPGPDGTPLGSIRLENFRDGLEDYAYVKLLEEKLGKAAETDADPQWRRNAEAALGIPGSLVSSLTEYSRDPQELYAWRARLAELLETAPLP